MLKQNISQNQGRAQLLLLKTASEHRIAAKCRDAFIYSRLWQTKALPE